MFLPFMDLPTGADTSTSVRPEAQEFNIKLTSAELFEEFKRTAFDLSIFFKDDNFSENLDRFYKAKDNYTWFEKEDDNLTAEYDFSVSLPIKETKRIKVKIKSISKFKPQISI